MRWWDFIHSDPDILGGKSVVRGTRLSVSYLLSLLGAGWSERQLLDSFSSLTPESLRAIFAYAAAELPNRPSGEPTAGAVESNEGSWSPISLEELNDLIREAEAIMSPAERRVWDCIRIRPEKWQFLPIGDLGGGFWAVGILGYSVLWYNDGEGGFSLSDYSTYGKLAEYWYYPNTLHQRISDLCRHLNPGDATAEASPSGPPDG